MPSISYSSVTTVWVKLAMTIVNSSFVHLQQTFVLVTYGERNIRENEDGITGVAVFSKKGKI